LPTFAVITYRIWPSRKEFRGLALWLPQIGQESPQAAWTVLFHGLTAAFDKKGFRVHNEG
jgi:hypothetical protein